MAHIVPDFLYKPIRNDKNFFKSFTDLSLSNNSSKPESTGMFDKNILCDKCDNWINKEFEQPFLNTIHDQIIEPNNNSSIYYNDILLKVSSYDNINSENLKLFLLSILWRSCISTMEHSKAVELENKIQAKLKKTLIRKQISGKAIFPILIFRNNDIDFNPYVISYPVCYQTKSGIKYFKYIVGSFILCFFIPNTYQKADRFILDNAIDISYTRIIELPNSFGKEIFLQDVINQ